MVVRAMPNTPAAIGRGITVAVAAKNVSAAQRAIADALLRATGSVEWVDDESLMDAVTAVSGSGPAYVFLLAEELARAGVEAGLPAELATRLARETVAGSGELLHRSELASATLRQNVTSPGGTTAAALEVLMGQGRPAAADDPRDRRGDEAVEGTGEVILRSRLILIRMKSGTRALLRPEPLVKPLDIDEAAGVAALADLALAFEGLDLEADHAALHRDHLCRGPHRRADQRRREMADIDLGADRDPARLQASAGWRRPTPSPFPGSSSASHRPSACPARNARPCAPAARPACARRSCRS